MPLRKCSTEWMRNHMNKNDKTNNEERTTSDEITISKKEYEELKAKSGERDAYCDKYMRSHAEFENARKRMEKDKMDYARFANDSLILDFLPILDSLEIAEKHIKEAKDFK